MNIGGYVYGDSSSIQTLEIIPVEVIYRWSAPSLIHTLEIIPVEVIYRWSAPSLTHTLAVGGLSLIEQPIASKIYFNRTIRVEVVFPEAVKAKAALEDVEYDNMPYVISAEAKTNHIATVTLPPESEGSFSLYIKTVNGDNSPGAYMSSVEFFVEKAPTGEDTAKLLRTRKFSKDGEMSRWGGKLAA